MAARVSKMIAPRRLIWVWLAACLSPGPAVLPSPVLAQMDAATRMVQSMTVEQRVGQLFMVPFVGSSADDDSDIARLVTDYQVGGVVLLAANQNFTNNDTTPRQVARLIHQLQQLALANGPLPLLVAIDHEGDGFPFTRITGGVTALPSAMTIGATWDSSNAEAVGEVVGRELSAMGINMLLGPTVDVLNNPRPTAQGDIGVRSFGGDPFWVGSMGRAYVRGVHRGSAGRMATVAKHFPGHGGSDRLPDDEIATVDKSLQELRRIELPPFFRVTDLNEEDDDGMGVTDGLMSSHIRYRGFQDDIRQFTGPISFDAESMGIVLGLPELSPWRDQGGLLVSDSLGVPAVRKYYDPTLTTFPHRRIAKEAFWAGNDLLILAQFDLNDRWADQFENIKDTVVFFCNEYRTDPAFAARVDEAAARVVRLKLKLYPDSTPTQVLVDPEAAMQAAGAGQAVTSRIARQALTLVYPGGRGRPTLSPSLPAPPRADQTVLVVSDARKARDCYDCPYFELLPADAVQRTILRLYGPQGTGQISPDRISSLTFLQLKTLLTGSLSAPLEAATPAPPAASGAGDLSPDDVKARIQAADWIIFVTLDLNTARYPESDALKLFLSQGGPILMDKRVVVLALNGPYYLDTTETSKLAAYLCVYSKIPASIEAAVRALFGELPAPGAAPVSIEGVGYDLVNQLMPAPSQPLVVRLLDTLPDPPLPPLTAHVGVGPLLDRNGHPVPDGTTVDFVASWPGDNGPSLPASTSTRDGLATITLRLGRAGMVEVRAQAGQARSQQALLLEVASPPTATPLPTDTPTATPVPTHTATPTATAAATPTLTRLPATTATPSLPAPASPSSIPATVSATGPASRPLRRVDGVDLAVALGIVLLAGSVGFGLRRGGGSSVWLRPALLAFIGGLAGYLLYAMGGLQPDRWWPAGTAAADLPAPGIRLALAGLVLLGSLIALLADRTFQRGRRH